MEILAASGILESLDFVLSILYVAIGLGLVIFFHELGHFAVAKWCDVHVERFSIGFGPVLFSWGRGETEYALSAIPFGGYVKMLGQDDTDPSQLSAEEIAQDPRSYSAKSVPKRMAIISAGVIMNVITAVLFFAVAFRMGVETESPIVGLVQPGMPAWQAGIQHGDEITQIDDREVSSFSDIMRGVALSTGPIKVEGVQAETNRTFTRTITPDMSGTRRMIGVGPSRSLQVIDRPETSIAPIVRGTPADQAEPPLQPGDIIRKIGIPREEGEPDVRQVASYAALHELLARPAIRRKPLDFWVQRKEHSPGDLLAIRVPPGRFRQLGLWMDIGQVSGVVQDSPAEQAGLKQGDKIVKVNGREVGTDINPLRLPDYFARFAGEQLDVVVKRPVQGADPEEITLPMTPTDRPGWLERPVAPDSPLSVPSLGFAFHLTRTVLAVDPGSPAEGVIRPGERLREMTLFLPEGAPEDRLTKGAMTIDLDGEADNWAYAFWMMQTLPTRKAKLTVSDAGEVREVTLDPRPISENDWFLPTRGIRLDLLSKTQLADNLLGATSMAFTHTRNTLADIYLTLRNLIGGFLSVKELHGPIGIATVAYKVATQGLAKLLLFLGFLSVNLAVLNFLPIPVLDGGHMVFLLWEGITRKKPSERVLVAATYLGMIFVLGLMMLVIYLDIFVHGMSTG